MATTTIRPNGTGHESGHTAVGDTPTWKCVDEISSDGDTTYVRLDSGSGDTDFYTFENPTIPAGATINSVTVYMVARALQNGDSIVVMTYTGSANEDVLTASVSTSFATYSVALTTNPSTGSAWTGSELNSLEIGIRVGSITIRGYVTQVYAVIDYTPAGRSWGQIMG